MNNAWKRAGWVLLAMAFVTATAEASSTNSYFYANFGGLPRDSWVARLLPAAPVAAANQAQARPAREAAPLAPTGSGILEPASLPGATPDSTFQQSDGEEFSRHKHAFGQAW